MYPFLGCYAEDIGNYLPTFRDNIGPETLVRNKATAPRNIPEKRRALLHRGGSLKSCRDL
jgi:hypothetical protein